MFAKKGIGKLLIYLNVILPCSLHSQSFDINFHMDVRYVLRIQAMEMKKLIHYAVFFKIFNLDFNHMYDRFSFNIFLAKRNGNFNQA